MKKLAIWPLSLLTSLISLAAMMLFDLILSVIYYFIGKVPFLTGIIDFIGEVLDLGLTALAAMFLAATIWEFGHSVIEKINGSPIDFKKSPIVKINNWFIFIFLAFAIFFIVNFAVVIADVVTAYTAGLGGMGEFLMFCKAIKDTAVAICRENVLFYSLGVNSLILWVINIFTS